MYLGRSSSAFVYRLLAAVEGHLVDFSPLCFSKCELQDGGVAVTLSIDCEEWRGAGKRQQVLGSRL